jgi:hypothetical protein
MKTYFTTAYPWSLVPNQGTVEKIGRGPESDLSQHFRFTGKERLAQDCGPWRLGRSLGWVVQSPIDVKLAPLDDVAVNLAEEDGASELAGALGVNYQLWHRRVSSIAVRKNSWLHLHQFRGHEGQWEGMFLPNGQGTLEWRLGWNAHIEDQKFLVVLPLDGERRFEVPTGVLSHKQLDRMAEHGGMSIPLQPVTQVALRRGDPIARLLVVGADVLRHE